MRLLVALAGAPGQLVSADTLLEAVSPGVVVTPASLYEAVAELRKAIGRDHVATVQRKGYRLVAPVAEVDTLPAPPSGSASHRLGPRSIAVLPFRVRHLPDGHAFIPESLADDLIAELSRQPGLVVVARGSMLGYAGQDAPPLEVSRDLGARYVVDGLLEVRGDVLHVTVQVIDGARGTQSWADAVELPMAAWPDTGFAVAGRLARALNFELLDLASRVPESDERDLRALSLATRAWVELFARTETREVNQRAWAWANEASELEPRLPLASVCLAFCHWRAAQFGWLDEPQGELLGRALVHIERAIELGPRDPDAHYVLGLIAYTSRDAARAEEALRHCLRLSSSHAPAYGLLALIRTRRGHPEEAAALCERAFALSPREPLRVVWHLSRAWAALAMGDFALALEESQRGIAVNADFATCHVTAAAAAQALGDVARARAAVAFLRERTAFSSVRAFSQRFPPASTSAHQRQIDQASALLLQAGLPAA